MERSRTERGRNPYSAAAHRVQVDIGPERAGREDHPRIGADAVVRAAGERRVGELPAIGARTGERGAVLRAREALVDHAEHAVLTRDVTSRDSHRKRSAGHIDQSTDGVEAGAGEITDQLSHVARALACDRAGDGDGGGGAATEVDD